MSFIFKKKILGIAKNLGEFSYIPFLIFPNENKSFKLLTFKMQSNQKST